jgi:cytochrome P450
MIGDRTIPEGTIVSFSPWIVHYPKELWGNDAHGFNPNRWFGSNAAQLER